MDGCRQHKPKELLKRRHLLWRGDFNSFVFHIQRKTCDKCRLAAVAVSSTMLPKGANRLVPHTDTLLRLTYVLTFIHSLTYCQAPSKVQAQQTAKHS
eukprot:6437762-Amphidinium_carterae.3